MRQLGALVQAVHDGVDVDDAQDEHADSAHGNLGPATDVVLVSANAIGQPKNESRKIRLRLKSVT